MYILINSSSPSSVAISLGLNNNWVQYNLIVTDGLLAAIVDLLEQKNLSVADLEGVAVVVGQGSFTSVRIAVTIANTLAFTNKIPVVGIMDVNFPELSQIIAATPVGQYISAQYSAPPLIGGQV